MMHYGLIGQPVHHSLSPTLWNEFFLQHHIRATYRAWDIDVADLPTFLKSQAKNLSGFNVTAPYKESIIPLLDEIDERALRLGAVNAVRRESDRWVGTNWDADGLLAALPEAWLKHLGSGPAIILGAGGAARAVLDVCHQVGVSEVWVWNRSTDRLSVFQNWVKKQYPDLHVITQAEARGLPWSEAKSLWQTTSAGWSQQKFISVPWESLVPQVFCIDLVYGSQISPWLHDAARHGAQIMDGSFMLAEQAALTAAWWLSIAPPSQKMRELLQSILRTQRVST